MISKSTAKWIGFSGFMGILLTILTIGCNDSGSKKLPPNRGYGPDFAWELSRENSDNSPLPIPTPAPIVGSVCTYCGGTGKIDGDHDGRTDADCLPCGGDGRIDAVDFQFKHNDSTDSEHSVAVVPQVVKDYVDKTFTSLVDIKLTPIYESLNNIVKKVNELEPPKDLPGGVGDYWEMLTGVYEREAELRKRVEALEEKIEKAILVGQDDPNGDPNLPCPCLEEAKKAELEKKATTWTVTPRMTIKEHYIIRNGQEYTYNAAERAFVGPDGYRITVSNGDPVAAGYMQMCSGGFCTRYEVYTREVTSN